MRRREFLVYSGSFSLLATLPGLQIVNASMADQTQLSSPDAVLSIDESGKVTFISPYTEMGQGSPTAASMIIADELHTNLDQLNMQTHDGKYATQDESFQDRFNGAGSGGSQSMATGWIALREIGAAARTSLIMAAAHAWKVDPSECDTETDCVVHKGSKQRLEYGKLVKLAASQSVPDQLSYRNPDDYQYVGTKRVRPDMAAVVTGQQPYAMDQHLPDLLYASIERCPSQQGAPAEFNRDQVMQTPGVVDVFTLDPTTYEAETKCSVVIVAKDTWSALQGRRALTTQWNNQNPSYRNEQAFWQTMEQQLASDQVNAEHTVGDYENVDLDGLRVVEATYRTPHQNQSPMEPIAITAHHRGDQFEIWTGTQFPGNHRERIAEITGLNQDQIIFHNRVMGGSFGRKYVPDGLTELTMIATRLRKPVKLVWTREDDIQHGQYRDASISSVEAHLDDSGQIKRWRQKLVQPNPSDPANVTYLASGMSDQAYTFEAARFEVAGIKGNVNRGPMRSPPHPGKLFPTVCFIDELAHELGKDPIDMHIELIGAARDIPQSDWLSGNGHVDNTVTHIEVAQAVRRLSNWDQPMPEGRGKGFSVAYIFGTHIGMVVEVAEKQDLIHIEKVYCSVNCGRVINPDVARQQVEGGIIYGLSSAMSEVISTETGGVVQSNFHDYPLMRFAQAPEIIVEFIPSNERPSGLGEPPTPPAYPALANAIFAATGQRIREIPLNRHIQFANTRSFS